MPSRAPSVSCAPRPRARPHRSPSTRGRSTRRARRESTACVASTVPRCSCAALAMSSMVSLTRLVDSAAAPRRSVSAPAALATSCASFWISRTSCDSRRVVSASACATTRYSSIQPVGLICACRFPSPTRLAAARSCRADRSPRAASRSRPPARRARPSTSSDCTSSCCRVTTRSASASIARRAIVFRRDDRARLGEQRVEQQPRRRGVRRWQPPGSPMSI